jgi:hypothetical protein
MEFQQAKGNEGKGERGRREGNTLIDSLVVSSTKTTFSTSDNPDRSNVHYRFWTEEDRPTHRYTSRLSARILVRTQSVDD